MITALILYYLMIKPTHGYEIQKFLQVSGAEAWAKIQSGSIYYALTKLEKNGSIEELREEKTGARIRKIYQITPQGRKELIEDLCTEINTPIVPAGSSKFLLYSMFDALSKDEIERNLKKHLGELKEQQVYWKTWKEAKISDESGLEAERIAFDMSIDSLRYQILWHEELLNNLDLYIQEGSQTRHLIQTIDFAGVDASFMKATKPTAEIDEILNLRTEILKDPQKAVESIDKLLHKLQK